MKKYLKIILLILFLVSNVNAQSARTDLQKLNKQINTAKELLRMFPNPQAELLIQNAEKLRNEAISLYANNRSRLAIAKAKTALTLVNKAINLLSKVPVERIKERVDELIRNAEQLIIGKNNKEAERLLRQAKQFRKNAYSAYQKRDNRKAIEHLRVAKFYAERAISMLQGPKGNIWENLNNEKIRYEELFQRAQEIVSTCKNEQARKLLNQARNQFQNIKRALQNGNNKIALNLYYSNTRLLLRAIDLCQGQSYSIREQAIEEVELFGNLLSTARDQPSIGQNDQDKFILQRVSRLYQQATEAINNENFAVAIRRATIGKNLLSRLWGSDSQQSMLGKTEQELEQLKADIERIKENSEIINDPKKEPLIRAAESSLLDAERFLAQGRVRLTLESIFAGNRFLAALESGMKQQPDFDVDKLNAELNRLQEAVTLLENSEQKDETTDTMLPEAKKMLQKAKLAIDKNQLELANEYLRLGNDLIEKSK